MKNKHSVEWCISAELAKQNMGLIIALVIVVAMWITTIVAWAMSDHIINNEAIESANTHEVQELCKDSLQTNGIRSFSTVISPIQSEK